MSVVLAIDVGNSFNKVGLFQIEAANSLPTCLRSRSVRADQPFPWSEIASWSEWCGSSSVIATTNPSHKTNLLAAWPGNYSSPHEITSPTEIGLPIDLLEPQRVGIDRVLNALAANRIRVPHCPVIIVDSGTATTVDVVTKDGVFVGGAILPGFELAARSLHRSPALLPLIPIDELHESEPAPIGNETRSALRSGLFWGQIGAVRELVSRVNQSLGMPPESEATLILTGGGSELLRPYFPDAMHAPHLALQGLALAALQNPSR